MKKDEAQPGAPGAENPAGQTQFQVPVAPGNIDFEADKGAGFENMGSDDYAIPFLMILQSGSPQCKRNEGDYVEGAQEGMLFNSVTRQFYKSTDGKKDLATLIPCYYKRLFIEREAGEQGKFVREVPVEVATAMAMHANEDKEMVNESGNVMLDTRQFYCLAIDSRGVPTPVLVSMGSTQIRKAKAWSSLMDNLKMRGRDGKLYTPPIFSHRYTITTVPESNDKGSWYGWKIEVVGPVTEPELYNAAKNFQQAVRLGSAKAASYAPEPAEKAEKF